MMLSVRGVDIFAGLLAFLSLVVPAKAVNPDEMLKDPVLESRARRLSQDLRCVVCQNQSIDDSNAPLAADLRVLLRERLSRGDSDAQAVKFLVSRYGNFVLLRPPFQINTVLLWLGPALALLAAVLGFAWYFRSMDRASIPEAKQFTKEDQKRLDELLKEEIA
jgi:cytochrome c-type biogenesis protein CcmH